MNERLLKIMEHFNYSPSIFADEIGVIRSSISHIISGRNNPGLELLQKVLIRFPQISSDWLLLARGEMILSEEEQEKKRITNVNQPRKIGQLSLDDFTTPRQNPIQDAKPSAAPVESNIKENIFSKPVQEPQQTTPQPVIKETTENIEPKLKQPEVAIGIQTAIKSKSGVKRITLFYEDNSFQDFIEEKK
jgi:hypothetical protein